MASFRRHGTGPAGNRPFARGDLPEGDGARARGPISLAARFSRRHGALDRRRAGLAHREPVYARIARWARRHRTAVAAIALSLVTAVVLLTVSNVLVRHAQSETARALSLVKEEQGRTVAALDRADSNFRRARQAVDDYFTTVADEILLDEPGMEPLREKLLRSAMKYHEQFFKERAGDQSVAVELAESHERYAIITIYTGGRDDPLPHLRIAHEQFAGLARQHPERPEYRASVARALSDTATALHDRQPDREESIRAAREAIAIYEQLLREWPENEAIQEGLALTLVGLGQRIAAGRGGTKEGTRHMERAREMLQGLVAKRPESLRQRLMLAEVYDYLYGNLVGNQRRQDEALESSQSALTVYKKLLERAPLSPRFKSRLGMLHGSRGRIYFRKGMLEEAINEARQARSVLRDVVRANPQNDLYALRLAMVCSDLGTWLSATDAVEPSLEALREACDAFEPLLKERPGDMGYQEQYIAALVGLGGTMVRLGRYDEAASVFKRGVESPRLFVKGTRLMCSWLET